MIISSANSRWRSEFLRFRRAKRVVNRAAPVRKRSALAKMVAPHAQQPPRGYDYICRVRKVSHAHDGDDWIESEAVEDIRYIYDGWNLIMERDASGSPLGTTETVRHKYAWGLDLAGLNGAAASGNVQSATQGAGGISGLLAMEDCTPHLGLAENPAFLYCYDGNGNVMQLVTWKDGDPDWYEVEPDEWVIPIITPGFIAANYEYDPYGCTLLAQANFDVNNPFRFSTKYYDAQPSAAAEGERGLYYYGYRYYSPRLGRWVTRDPSGESGGTNLVQFCSSAPNNYFDPFGESPEPGEHIQSANEVLGQINTILAANSAFFHGQATAIAVLAVTNGFATGGQFFAVQDAAKTYFDLKALAFRFDPGGNIKTSKYNAFVYTCKCGWIDVGHLFNSARVGQFSGELLALAGGYGWEIKQEIFRRMALAGLAKDEGDGASAFTLEDIPSDWYGSKIGARLGAGNGFISSLWGVPKKSPVTIPRLMQRLFDRCEAINPKSPGNVNEAIVKGTTMTVRQWLEYDLKNRIDKGYPLNGFRNYWITPINTPCHNRLCRGDGTSKYP
ncbi:MAG: hypothetical protein IPK83_07380 [Planctomycetes bacterium]|nr:hypothetical protein [Planctomycetota bacterium]